MGTAMAKALGARVIGVDLTEERLALSRTMGADETINPRQVKLGDAVRELTGGRGADLAFETSGSRSAHGALIDLLRRQGRAALVGFGSTEPSVNLTAIIANEITLMGSYVMPIHYYDDLVRFMLAHDLHSAFKRMITHRFSIDEAPEAFRVADEAKSGKIMFVWD
jgi:propanol-preferring alcohol dehydrogenase